MKFVWDEDKNHINIRKHAIDFADVSLMFNHPTVVDIDDRSEYGELRFVAMGILKHTIAVVVYTEPDDETVRIISARKALKHERKKYEQEITNGLETP